MTNNKLKYRVNKLLSFKNKDYQRKFYALSRLSESDLNKNKVLFEEFKCLVRSLNLTNGDLPSEKYIFEFLKNNITNDFIKEIKESIDLKYSKSIRDFDSLINEELDKVNYVNKELDLKLESILIKSIEDKIDLLESRTSRRRRRSLDNIDGPSQEELEMIQQQLDDEFGSEDLDSVQQKKDEEDFSEIDLDDLPDNDLKPAPSLSQPVESIYKKVKSKEQKRLPKGPSNNKIAKALGFTGTGKYVAGQKSAVLQPWDQLVVYVSNKLKNSGVSQENDLSLLAKRKLWIIMSIEVYLTLESQSNMMLGISDSEKDRMVSSLDQKQKLNLKNAVSSFRRSVGLGKSLSSEEIRSIIVDVKEELSRGDFDLESDLIREQVLLRLWSRSGSSRNKNIQELKQELDIMYPLNQEYTADFDLEPRLSDDELEKLKQQNIEFDKRISGDPDQDDNFYIEEEINITKELEDYSSKNRNLSLTVFELQKYMKQISEDIKRLNDLYKKSTERVNPDIFNPIEEDEFGNIINIPDTIPAEDLSEEEENEIKEILERLSYKDKINIINVDKKRKFYRDLYDNYASIDDVIKKTQEHVSKFGLDKKENLTDVDISHMSYGQFASGAGVRQLAQKAWSQELFYSCNPDEKARIYSTAADRWIERLVKLDLIDDKSFVRVPSKNEDEADVAISSSQLKQLELQGKYKRSNKLEDVSDYFSEISKILTDTKLLQRYFDEARDDSVAQEISEKINSIKILSDDDETSYNELLKDLSKNDKGFSSYLVLEASLGNQSGFSLYVIGLLDNFYKKKIQGRTKNSIIKATKEYFDTHYGKDILAPGLSPSSPRIEQIKKDEGQNIFASIANVVQTLSGLGSSGSKGISKSSEKSTRDSQRDYFLNPGKGYIVGKVEKLNANRDEDDQLKSFFGGEFNKKDVEKLLDDMFSPNGIIGSVYEELKILTKTTADELINHIYSMSDSDIDESIIKAFASSEFKNRTDFDVLIPKVFDKIGKDSKEALENYKELYGSLLIGKDFADYLDSEFGLETIKLPKTRKSRKKTK